MPLLDHFRPPLSDERSWESFHATWAGTVAEDLNARLPAGYFAEQYTHAGAGVEIDVGTWDRNPASTAAPVPPGLALLEPAVWAPPAPARTVGAVFADDFEVKVISTQAGPRLVAALEFISPRNKDRPAARQAFAVKCVSYLHQGVSVVIVDVVTDRRANLHQQILEFLPEAGGPLLPPEARLYAVAHRPIRRDGVEQIDLWAEALEVGRPLPVLPLAISGEVCLPIDLEATYEVSRRKSRL